MNIENRILTASGTDKKPDVSGGEEAQEAGQKKKTGKKAAGERLKERARRRKALILKQLEQKRLRRVRRKTVPAYTHCKNCGTELKGMYCHRCGQYALDVEQPFWKYIKQYFENAYSFDNKIWITLWMLFRRPGFLTTEFNSGKIVSYVHPMKLLMFISLLFFLFFFIKVGKELDTLKVATDNLSETTFTDIASSIKEEDEGLYTSLAHQDKTETVAIVADSSSLAMYPELFEIIECSPTKISDNGKRQDTLLVKTSELITGRTEYVPEQTWKGAPLYAPGQNMEARALNNQKDIIFSTFLGEAGKWTPILVLLLTPFMALLCRIFYHRCRVGYMGNFVFVLHLNSLAFIALTVFILLCTYLPDQGRIWSWLFLLYMIFYTTVASHRVYPGTGWVKSAVKSLLMWFIFLIVISIAVLILTIIIAARINI
ncbi:MAG TPA: DUF3667 domain-containing protein [Candidatus Coprenecus stercoravium]|uniref:DUF3667 domain-containing protein n=1 Tax=Candidatus Coprenecus stercoravium TaxID=2840735 RepID=A0A9D2GPL7_9BACT|nr:DUF3667 domain-containing protein [Candidatus Coprenecus stercoravium]